MKRTALAAVVAAFVPSIAAATWQTVPYLPIPKYAAVILNTGSTNTSGFRIVVQQSGAVEYVSGSSRARGDIPASLATKFFHDLSVAMPLSKIHTAPCMKSASFGTYVFVWWRGERSPDVTCPGDSNAQALQSDAGAIADTLHLAGNLRGHAVPMLPNEPRKPLPAPVPSPTGTR
jgi:hypothetical protein